MDHRDHRLASRDIKAAKSPPKAVQTPQAGSNDRGTSEFVIGVQDWRDPDLFAPKTSLPRPKQSTSTRKESPLPRRSSKDAETTPESAKDHSVPRNPPAPGMRDLPKPSGPPSRESDESKAREGLWVTLTPASMATSPFFDTLLVLVVSPLLTLSIVYALLLLRSRIRRRRWRAPKSVVDRLPVRTYHTIPPTPSSSASSTRSASPESASPTDPLIGPRSASEVPRSKSKSKTPARAVASKNAFSSNRQGSTLWRRKYTGRQVECAVCLEEYVDGESRVMSLPCGHEFHAECM